jgi:hypothetical protein
MCAAALAASCRRSLCRPSWLNQSSRLAGPQMPEDPPWTIPIMSPGKATPRAEPGNLAGDREMPFAGAAIRSEVVDIEKICSGRSPTVGSPSRRSQRRRAESKQREMLPTTLFKSAVDWRSETYELQKEWRQIQNEVERADDDRVRQKFSGRFGQELIRVEGV